MQGHLAADDKSWITQAYLITNRYSNARDIQLMSFSDAQFKYTDSTLGGNLYINTPPQFSRFTDIPVTSNGNHDGFGRYFSEAIDDNAQIVHFRMGKPRFNTLSSFYNNAYKTELGDMVNRNRINRTLFNVGKALGYVVSVISFPLFIVRLVAESIKFLTRRPNSRYYYLEPAHNQYWQATGTILNQILVNRGILAKISEDKDGTPVMNEGERRSYTKDLHNALPDIFSTDGGIDIYSLANKAKRRERHFKQQWNNFSEKHNGDPEKVVEDYYNYLLKNKYSANGLTTNTLKSFISLWYGTGLGENPNEDSRIEDTDTLVKTAEENQSGFLNYAKAELDDGSMFASFRVNNTGTINETFSNSVTEPEIKQKLDSATSSSRSLSFSTAGGNITETIGNIMDGVRSVIGGVLDSFGVGGLMAAGGGGYFDIPKVWESSEASMPTASYTINLRSPYGNPISQLINIYVPLSMLLAMSLPQSTGRQSYSQPFLIEYYDKGRQQTRLGIVQSLSISRGVGSLPFNAEGVVLSIDVNLTIMDLSSIVHMPITMGQDPFGAASNTLRALWDDGIVGGVSTALGMDLTDEYNSFTDYMAIISSLGVADQIYTSRKIKLAATKRLANIRQWSTTSNMASLTASSFPGRVASAFFKGVSY